LKLCTAHKKKQNKEIRLCEKNVDTGDCVLTAERQNLNKKMTLGYTLFITHM